MNRISSLVLRVATVATVSSVAVIGGGTATALADDHLFNGATSAGAEARGFKNPVANNPSGVSFGAAQPQTVPGLGNPNAGADTGTPAFNCETLQSRLAARSSGAGPTC